MSCRINFERPVSTCSPRSRGTKTRPLGCKLPSASCVGQRALLVDGRQSATSLSATFLSPTLPKSRTGMESLITALQVSERRRQSIELSQRNRTRFRRRLACRGASRGQEGEVDDESDSTSEKKTEDVNENENEESGENFMLKFVQEVKPQVMEQFTAQASPQVVEAMKQTISNMLGTLPAKYFDVTVKTVGENLAQLMLSVMMTGYMFRNAQYRMDVTKTLALPSPSEEDEEEYAEGSQQINISGEVLRWHNEKGPESVDAMKYIEQLEKELSTLREQVSMQEKANEEKNYLLKYLQRLEPGNIKELTSSAGEEVVEAMNAFIKRLVGTDYDSDELKGIETKSTSVEMARLLYWLLIVGYSLRTIEVRKELQKELDKEDEEEEQEEQEEQEEGEDLTSDEGVAAAGPGRVNLSGMNEDEDERNFMDRSFDDDSWEHSQDEDEE